MRSRVLIALVFAVSASLAGSGCFRPVKKARTNKHQLPSAEEVDSAARLRSPRCSAGFAYLFPGLGQFCSRKDVEAQVLAGLTVAEAGTAIYAGTQVTLAPNESALEHPAVFVPVTAIQDLYVYGIADTIIDRNLASGAFFSPRDSLADLALAPFNLEVMGDPKVFLGIAGMLALGIGVTAAISEFNTDNSFGDPNVFGRQFSPAAGYGLGAATFGGLFTHVAIAEETMFRGVVQSALARSQGETEALIYGSLIFGAIHAPNALAFEGDDRRDYVLYALPTITVIGTYLSYLYKDSEYSLAPSTAAHFWYDFLLSAASMVIEPDNSLISAKIGWGF